LLEDREGRLRDELTDCRDRVQRRNLHIDELEQQVADARGTIRGLEADLRIRSLENGTFVSEIGDLQDRIVELEQNFRVLNRHFDASQRRISESASQLKLFAQYILTSFRGDVRPGFPVLRQELQMLEKQVAGIASAGTVNDVTRKVLMASQKVSRLQGILRELETASLCITGKSVETDSVVDAIGKYVDCSEVPFLSSLLSFRWVFWLLFL
jgi:chromosome segregation ATPase